MRKILAILFLLLGVAIHGHAAEGIYPQGKRFPLGLYSIETGENMNAVKQFGWNISHTYHFTPPFLEQSEANGMQLLAGLPGESELIPESDAARAIQSLSGSDSIAWWDFPEERRWWRKHEMALVVNYSRWTRQYDPGKRPNFMYIPGNYSMESVAKYVPYLDIIPASVYTTYGDKPHAWVRWRMESTVRAITEAGYRTGPEYLQEEKTPVAILELFHGAKKKGPTRLMTPAGARHDFWQSIASGAQGILIFSHYHKRDKPQFEANWEVYCEAAAQLTGSEQLGQMILHGEAVKDLKFEVTKGPSVTDFFKPVASKDAEINFPSINLLAKVWRGSLYVILVNSAVEPVNATIMGLPGTATKAAVLFENRSVQLEQGEVAMSFPPLGVHILKIPAD